MYFKNHRGSVSCYGLFYAYCSLIDYDCDTNVTLIRTHTYARLNHSCRSLTKSYNRTVR